MVITTSDSNTTLVSFDDRNALKRSSSLLEAYAPGRRAGGVGAAVEFRATSILIPPEDEFLSSEESDDDGFGFCPAIEDENLYIPTECSDKGVDECLKCLPTIMDRRDALLAQGTYTIGKATRERFLYVGQGEVAHSTPSQNDILVSDRATTCHILALRSASRFSEPLSTLTHLDGTMYEACVRDMIAEHQAHHNDTDISIDIHIVGGFQDEKESSRKISNWLLRLLADLAYEFRTSMTFTLRTAMITSMNEKNGPIGRGLALNCLTGNVCLAECDSVGPLPQLRSARLWSQDNQTLHKIFTHNSNILTIQPFTYKTFRGLDSLLKLDDRLLLHYCSTSPAYEASDFCSSLRQTLQLMQTVSCTALFANGSLVFARCGKRKNVWIRTA